MTTNSTPEVKQARTRRYEYTVDGRIVKPSADAGAAVGPTLPVYECNRCGRKVVWCESKRTGRKYLAHVAHHTSDGMSVDSFWYNAGSVHTDEACQAAQDRTAANLAHMDEIDTAAERAAENTRIAIETCYAEAVASGDAEYVRRVRRIAEMSGVTLEVAS